MSTRLFDWFRSHVPKREEIEKIRWLRPVAHHVLRSDLWRFHRRSVPRGVAIGLFVGIFLLIPGLQIIGVALVAIPARANVPLGIAMTFLSNPFTTPFIVIGSMGVGNKLFGYHADVAMLTQLLSESASFSDYVRWALSDAAPALMAGLGIVSLVAALVGYGISVILWRWWIGRKWRHRTHERALRISTAN